MAEALSVSPGSVDLGSFAWGSFVPIKRVLTLKPSGSLPLRISLCADGALASEAGLVSLSLVSDEAGHSGVTCDANPDQNLAALGAATAPDPATKLELPRLGPGSSVRVLVSFSPAVRPPHDPPELRSLDPSPGSSPPDAQHHGALAGHSAARGTSLRDVDDKKCAFMHVTGVLRVVTVPLDCVGEEALERELEVPVFGDGCVSVVAPDVEELQFYQCVHGSRYVKDFTVSNLSEISTAFHISLSDRTLGAVLEFSDFETGERIEHRHIPLGANDTFRVGLAFQSDDNESSSDSAFGQCWFAVENVLDPRNVSYVKVASYFSSVNLSGCLEFSCGDHISFGSCYTANPVYRTIDMRNKLSQPVSVSLRSSVPDEVSFGLVMPELSGKSGDLGAEEEHLRLMASREANDRDKGLAPVSTTQEDMKAYPSARGPGLLKSPTIRFEARESRRLRVWYAPEPIPGVTDTGRLSRRSFQLLFRYSHSESRVVTVNADVCESIITLGTTELNLGDCDVLSTVRSSVTLFNLSDLPAQVHVKCESKCVTPESTAVTVEPRQSFDLGVAFLPRTLNPDYVKEITFINKSNPRCANLIVTLRATNIDRKCISLHAVFYRVLDPGLTNAVHFGRCSANYPAIRAFRIQNVSSERLVLGFDRTPGVLSFVPKWNASIRRKRGRPSASFEAFPRDERQLGHAGASGEDKTSRQEERSCESSSTRSTSGPVLSRTLLALLDPDIWTKFREMALREEGAVEEPSQVLLPLAQYGSYEPRTLASYLQQIPVFVGLEWMPKSSAGASGVSLGEREELKRVWANDMFPPLSLERNSFSAMEDEIEWADEQLRPGRRLVDAIENEQFVRSNRLWLAAGEESVVCLAVIAGDQAVSRRAAEKTLRIRLLEYDIGRLEQRVRTSAWRGAMFSEMTCGDPPPRELVLSVQVCKSPVCIRPLQILNFGSLTAGSRRDKHFLIDNTGSSACLIFEVRKTGSVASGDVRLENGFESGRLGVVRPFSIATIPFQFRPSLPGPFREEIVVRSALDASASQVLTVKANVLRRSTFHIVPQSRTDFGVVECGVESEHALLLDVYNDTEKVREFTCGVIDRRRTSSNFPIPKVLISVRESYGDSEQEKRVKFVDSAVELELEAKRSKLEHYLKKGKAAKAEALRQEIAELEKSLPDFESDQEDLTDPELSGRRVSVNESTFSVAENSFATVEIALFVPRSSSSEFSVCAVESSPRVASSGITSVERSERTGYVPIAGQFLFSLGVFETKNRDRCLHVNCSCLIGAPTPLQERGGVRIGLEGGIGSGGPPPLSLLGTGRAMSPSILSVPDKSVPSSDVLASSFLQSARSDGPNSPVETRRKVLASPGLDFGNVQLGVAVRREVQIRNMFPSAVTFDAWMPNAVRHVDSGRGESSRTVVCSFGSDRMHAVVEIFGLATSVAPGSLHTLYVSFAALAPGQHTRTISVKPSGSSDSSAITLTLCAFCVRGDVVCLVPADSETESPLPKSGVPEERSASFTSSDLDLGYGAIDSDRDYVIVKKVNALSLVDVECFLTVRSSLSLQVMIYADEALRVPARNIVITARESVPLWIVVRTSESDSTPRDCTTRTLEGCLHVVTRYSERVQLSDTMIKFSARLGRRRIAERTRDVVGRF